MQSLETINNTLAENLNLLHELQRKTNLSEQDKGMISYYHGVVKTLRWVKSNFGRL